MNWKKRIVPLLITLSLIGVCQAQFSVAMLEYRSELPEPPTYLSAQSYSLPFELVRNMIHVKARLDNTPQRFVFDTGAPCLVLNGIPTRGTSDGIGSGGPVTVEYLEAANFAWLPTDRSRPVTIRVDLHHLEELAGVPISGLIGFDLFKDREVYLNYEQQRLLFLPSGENELHRNQKPVYALPFELADHLPVIHVRIDGKELRLALDTGAAASVLRRERVNALPADRVTWREKRNLQGLDRKVETVRTFSIDQLDWRNGPVLKDLLFLESDLSAFDHPDYPRIDGILGYDFFQRFKLSIDYPGRKIYIWQE